MVPDSEPHKTSPSPTQVRGDGDHPPPLYRELLPYVAPSAVWALLTVLWTFGPWGAAQPQFFRAAATVIPTLLLTLAVQARYFATAIDPSAWSPEAIKSRLKALVERRSRPVLLKLYAVQILVIFGLGEFAALVTLGSKKAH
jgi:hypothetical protein